ncbi:SirB1 family protein [Aerosakkonema funiforme]|uniref:Tetratricopeptide repeat protein n=1 Tax=Aerosakkonema funiforme FACHB-1375 TaxID=2949571 RepID=A0A926VK72_9CYAN|nr:tetratricopeptide repeat protein [Aerosakkonema funiforme]MBD2185326.1 tetratricopeptide repeat protein [Aerosakkonema funiforme FACHB-1375]
MDFPLARQYFYQEIHQPDKQINLAKAALHIAQEEYPELDPIEYLNALDTMAAEVEELLPPERYPLRIVQSINKYLYEDLGFVGNTVDYYDPRNSYLNEVIERRTGIPITLSLLYLEIAQRIDFPMVGIGMPGHFLIRPDFEDVGIYVDAFNRGEILFEADCQQRLSQIYQQPIELNRSFVEPVSNRRFLARMLMNLKLIYLNQNELEKALAVIERLLLLFPGVSAELRDRGLLYYQLGQWTSACLDLETYLIQVPNADDADAIRLLVERMRQDL